MDGRARRLRRVVPGAGASLSLSLENVAQRQGLVVPQDRLPSVHREGRPKLPRVNPASVYPPLLNWETSGKFRKRKTKLAIV